MQVLLSFEKNVILYFICVIFNSIYKIILSAFKAMQELNLVLILIY